MSLLKDDPVRYVGPSIDVLFESVVDVYEEAVVAILLTRANQDGADGIVAVHQAGGMTLVQNPVEAEMSSMPEAAIATGEVDHIAPLLGIVEILQPTLAKRDLYE